METGGLGGMNRRIRDFFDERAEKWDEIVCPQHAERLAALMARLDIPREASILDVGCGTGVLFPLLAPAGGHARHVVAMDVSFNMLQAAVRRAGYPSDRTACIQADALAPPFKDAVFDWVVCNSVFPHFPDQGACARQLARVLVSGGRFVICHSQNREAINAMHNAHGGAIGGHELPDESFMVALMERAGLRPILLEDASDHYLLLAIKEGINV